MYGKNAVAKTSIHGDGRLNVNSIWYTVQGEGPDAGRPAIFIRLMGCNLRCYFCDTEFETGREHSLAEVVGKVYAFDVRHCCNLVVITGGEPFLQNVVPLVRHLNECGYQVSVETAGSVWVDGLEELFAPDRSIGGNLIVCSPKTPTLNPKIIPLIGALKYVVRHGQVDPRDGLPNMSTQKQNTPAPIFRPGDALDKVPIYLQPMDELSRDMREKNLTTAAQLCMKFGYRLSVQVHKMVGLD